MIGLFPPEVTIEFARLIDRIPTGQFRLSSPDLISQLIVDARSLDRISPSMRKESAQVIAP